MYDNIPGDQSLVKAIINQAIVDGLLFKNPRPPKKLVFNQDKKTMLKNILILSLSLKKKGKPIDLDKIILISQLFNFSPSSNMEKVAWEARQFFNPKNWMFSFYSSLLGIDPEYFAEKVKKYFIKKDLEK